MILNIISLAIYAVVMVFILIDCLTYIPNLFLAFLAYIIIGLGLGWFLKLIFNRKNKKSVNTF